MEELLKRELCLQSLKPVGGTASGGFISNGQSYQTDAGKIFVKSNERHQGGTMFNGEAASLNAIIKTESIRVPKPLRVFEGTGGKGWVFVMQHLDFKELRHHQRLLGEQLAKLHLYNSTLKDVSSAEAPPEYVDKFGFQCTTCLGTIPMPNTWKDSWIDFYVENRLQVQVDLLEKEYHDEELRKLWPLLRNKIDGFFEGVEIQPALLHGDLWSGNVGENEEGPVTFDPASFYGHHEFDLIPGTFGGFTKEFYDAYHQLIPKAPGFDARRQLYMLFNFLNQWNHFGSSYRSRSITLINELLSTLKDD